MGVRQGRDKFRTRRGTEAGRFGDLEVRRREPVNTSAIAAVLQIEFRMDVIGDRPWVLDGLAIHIDDVKRAVGCVD